MTSIQQEFFTFLDFSFTAKAYEKKCFLQEFNTGWVFDIQMVIWVVKYSLMSPQQTEDKCLLLFITTST